MRAVKSALPSILLDPAQVTGVSLLIISATVP
jgi:hypothetical protein